MFFRYVQHIRTNGEQIAHVGEGEVDNDGS